MVAEAKRQWGAFVLTPRSTTAALSLPTVHDSAFHLKPVPCSGPKRCVTWEITGVPERPGPYSVLAESHKERILFAAHVSTFLCSVVIKNIRGSYTESIRFRPSSHTSGVIEDCLSSRTTQHPTDMKLTLRPPRSSLKSKGSSAALWIVTGNGKDRDGSSSVQGLYSPSSGRCGSPHAHNAHALKFRV